MEDRSNGNGGVGASDTASGGFGASSVPGEAPNAPAEPGGEAPDGTSGSPAVVGAPTAPGGMPLASDGRPAPGPERIPQLEEGCVRPAWKDVVSTPGWPGMLAILGLMNCIFPLSLVTMGYSLQWGRSVPFGNRNRMPRSFFGDQAFLVGFCSLIVSIAYALMAGVVTFAVLWMAMFAFLGLVPLLAIPLMLLFAVMLSVAPIRMAVVGRIGAAFDLPKVWEAVWKAPGALLCVLFGPGLVAVAVSATAAGAVSLGTGMDFAVLFSAMDVSRVATMLITNEVNVPAGLLCAFSLFVSGMATVVTYRALGYWVLRTVPEWADEAVLK